jgi:hypothetical protein
MGPFLDIKYAELEMVVVPKLTDQVIALQATNAETLQREILLVSLCIRRSLQRLIIWCAGEGE